MLVGAVALLAGACTSPRTEGAEAAFAWAGAEPTTGGSQLHDRLGSPEVVAQETAVADATTVLVRRCMERQGFDYPVPAASASGGLYDVPPHFWEVEAWLRYEPQGASNGSSEMDRYLSSLPDDRLAAFDAAVASGPERSIDVLGQHVSEQTGGCRGAAVDQLWSDPGARMRSEFLKSNERAQAEQRVGQDPRFTAAAERFRACASEAGVAGQLYEDGALVISVELDRSAREVAIRCDRTAALAETGQARVQVAEAAYATYYEKDLRTYLSLLSEANGRALRVLSGG